MGMSLPSAREVADIAAAAGAVDMAQGVVHCPPPREFLDVLHRIFAERRTHVYGSPAGNVAYREAVANWLSRSGARVTPDMVMATNGVTGGLAAALLTHCRPGDDVALCEPFFPAHDWLVRSLHFSPRYVSYRADWSFDTAAAVTAAAQVRAFILVNPANPSGTLVPADDLQALYEACQEHNVLLVVDEVYKDFIWAGRHASLLDLADTYSHLAVLRSFSKNLALAGWRIGFTVSTPEWVRAMTQPSHEALYVGAPGPVQHVLAELLREQPAVLARFVEELQMLYRENRQAVIKAFRTFGMEPLPKEGAYYLLVKHGRESDRAAMQELLDRGIAVAPGTPFFRPGAKDTGFIRIHFALSREDRGRVVEILGGVYTKRT